MPINRTLDQWLFALTGIAILLPDERWISYLILGLALVITGIPHGATDLSLYKRMAQGALSKPQMQRFNLFYLGSMALYLLSWFFVPWLSLLIFMGISVYHFGQTHLCTTSITGGQRGQLLLYTMWGSLMLSILFLGNLPELHGYIEPIFPISAYIDLIQPWILPLLLIMWFGFNGLYFLLVGKGKWKGMLRENVLIGGVFALAYSHDLLYAFAVFFGLWHSIRAIVIQVESKPGRKFAHRYLRFLKDNLRDSLLSLAAVAVGTALLQFVVFPSYNLVIVFFIFISLISLPHTFVFDHFIHHLEERTGEKSPSHSEKPSLNRRAPEIIPE